jgi:ADP-ribose pyrophosphatase YjhB (NUDIX family)
MSKTMLDRTGFVHCPRCGHRGLVAHGNKACRCEACGFRYYQNPAAAVVAVVEHQGRLVLGRRAREPQRGCWGMPGGFVDEHETLEEATRRETREETGLEVEVFGYLGSMWNEYPYAGVTYLSSDAFFHCRVADLARLSPGDEVTEIAVVEPGAIDRETLAFESYRRALSAYLAAASLPQ